MLPVSSRKVRSSGIWAFSGGSKPTLSKSGGNAVEGTPTFDGAVCPTAPMASASVAKNQLPNRIFFMCGLLSINLSDNTVDGRLVAVLYVIARQQRAQKR